MTTSTYTDAQTHMHTRARAHTQVKAEVVSKAAETDNTWRVAQQDSGEGAQWQSKSGLLFKLSRPDSTGASKYRKT